MELAQKKFLRQVCLYSDNLDIAPYPRLFLLDYCTQDESNAIKSLNEEAVENALVKERESWSKNMNESISENKVKICYLIQL